MNLLSSSFIYSGVLILAILVCYLWVKSLIYCVKLVFPPGETLLSKQTLGKKFVGIFGIWILASILAFEFSLLMKFLE